MARRRYEGTDLLPGLDQRKRLRALAPVLTCPRLHRSPGSRLRCA